MPPQTIPHDAFGEVEIDNVGVAHAPQYTRIPLQAIQDHLLHIKVDRDNRVLIICDEVAYEPIEFDHAGMTLICELVGDRRLPMVQAVDRARGSQVRPPRPDTGGGLDAR